MIVGRLIGWALIFAAMLILGYEAAGWIDSDTNVWHVRAAGKLWFDIHPGSLNASQAGIQRYVLPELWDPVIQTVLTWPAWAVLGVPGILLAVLFRRRRRRR